MNTQRRLALASIALIVPSQLLSVAALANAYDDIFLPPPAGVDFGGPLAQLLVSPMQGVYDSWLTTPLNAAIVLRGDFEYRGQWVVAGADAALAALLPVEYRRSTGNTVIVLQVGGFVGGRPIPALAMGVRVQAVATVNTGPSRTEGYTSLIPFVRGEIGSGFIEGRLLMNLDEPWGFSFDPGGATGAIFPVWAIQLSGGASF